MPGAIAEEARADESRDGRGRAKHDCRDAEGRAMHGAIAEDARAESVDQPANLRPGRSFEMLSGVAMAVQQRRKSKSRRDMRRAHDALASPTLAIEPTSGETHRRHHVSADGFYRGRKVVPAKDE